MGMRCIEPARAPLDASLRAVPSKSATHRALVAAALAAGRSALHEPLIAEDTRRTRAGLEALGVVVKDAGEAWIVEGTGGTITGGGTLDLGASGTSARLLTALAAVGRRPSRLDGEQRLRDRPMDELIRALSDLGAHVRGSKTQGLPIEAGGVPVRGGNVTVPGSRSSQFASALVLAAPAFAEGLVLEVTGPRVSSAYFEMSLEILRAFGGSVVRENAARTHVAPGPLRATALRIEGDYSSASYFLAAAAICGGRVRVTGLRPASLQPDARFVRDLGEVGCRVSAEEDSVTVEGTGRIAPFDWDLADAPDLAPTAAVLGLFAEDTSRLSGLTHLALKESDRPEVLVTNLRRLGAGATFDGDTLEIVPPRAAHGASIDVANDHRIAMAFAIAGLVIPDVVIDHPEAVGKSYPTFWDDLERLVRTGSSAPDSASR